MGVDYSVLFKGQQGGGGLMGGLQQGMQMANMMQSQKFAREQRDAWRADRKYTLGERQRESSMRVAQQNAKEAWRKDPNNEELRQAYLSTLEPDKQLYYEKLKQASMTTEGMQLAQGTRKYTWELASLKERNYPKYVERLGQVSDELTQMGHPAASYFETIKKAHDEGMAEYGDDLFDDTLLTTDPESVKIKEEIESERLSQLTEKERKQKLEKENTKLTNELKQAAAVGKGEIPVDKKPDYELKLRNQYLKEGGADLLKIERANKNIQESSSTGVGSLTTILSYMKLLDPTSVVSPGEQATASSAPGWTSQMRQLWNKYTSKGEMDEAGFEQFKSEADKIYKNAKTLNKKIRDRITRQAKNYDLNVDNIFSSEEEEPNGGTVPDWYKSDDPNAKPAYFGKY